MSRERRPRSLWATLALAAATAAAMTVGFARPASCTRPAAAAAAVSCLEVKSRCVQRKGCSTALRNVLEECLAHNGGGGGGGVGSAGAGHRRDCSERCKWALASLASVEDDIGRDYLTCDCAGSEACSHIKSNISACADDAQRVAAQLADGAASPAASISDGSGSAADGSDGSPPGVSCHLAWMLCQADTSCSTALIFYERFCVDSWRQGTGAATSLDDDAAAAAESSHRCTRRCSNSVFVLYRQPKASRLRRCHCEHGDAMCARIRGNTARLCQADVAAASAASHRLSEGGATGAAPKSAARTAELATAAATPADVFANAEADAESQHSRGPANSLAAAAEFGSSRRFGATASAASTSMPSSLNMLTGALACAFALAWLACRGPLAFDGRERAVLSRH